MSANVLVEEKGKDGLSYTEGFRALLTDHPYPPSLMLRRAGAEVINYAYGILLNPLYLPFIKGENPFL